MWAECRKTELRRLGKRVFFIGKREHCTGLGECCFEVEETQAQRAAAMMAMQARHSNIQFWGCDAGGLPCARCLREQGKGLWTTTNAAPRPLEELFPSTQAHGNPPSDAEDGSSVQPSQSKRKRRIRSRKT